MKVALVSALLMGMPHMLSAQDPEYQLRFITHARWTPPGSGVGLAAWAILPNVMNEADPTRTLLLGGGLLRNRVRWVEVMAGALIHAEGTNTMLSVRYLERLPRWSLYLEGEHNVGDRKTSVVTNATVPAALAGLRLRAGLEGEWIHTPTSDAQIIGPRLTVTLPICGRLCSESAITTALRFHRDGHVVVRQYVVVTF